jgi:multiple sugar transport system ATP-binding protein
MRAEILKVHRAVAATAVYVTHDQVEALTMGDRIVVMNQGRVHQVGTPRELYDAPVDRFVASFIGTPAMGFIDCRVQESADRIELVAESTRVRLGATQARALSDNARVIVGIRAECLSIASGHDEPGTDVTVRGSVEVVEMLGAEQYVHVATGGGALTARVARDRPVRVGDVVTLAAAAGDAHLFDENTGAVIRWER